MKNILSIILLTICLVGANAQRHTVIQNVTFFGGYEALENVSVEVENHLIKNITKAEVQTSDSTNIIDGTGKTILPGLINSHVHVWDKAQLKQALRAGVFAVLDMHSPEEYTAKLRDLNLKEGYASYYSAGYAATVEGGHGTQFGYEVPVISDDFSPKDFVKERKKSNADYIKIIYEPRRPTLSLDQIDQLIKAAHEHDLLAVAHISTLKDGLALAKLGIDAFVHVWDDKVIAQDEVDFIVESGVFIIPTLAVHEKVKNYYKENEIENDMLDLEQIQANIKILNQHNVPILAGTDPPNLGVNYGSSLYRELVLLVASGLSPIQALQSATLNPATHFDLKNFGSLGIGMKANFILVDGNPTKNISDIINSKSVWVNGKKIH